MRFRNRCQKCGVMIRVLQLSEKTVRNSRTWCRRCKFWTRPSGDLDNASIHRRLRRKSHEVKPGLVVSSNQSAGGGLANGGHCRKQAMPKSWFPVKKRVVPGARRSRRAISQSSTPFVSGPRSQRSPKKMTTAESKSAPSFLSSARHKEPSSARFPWISPMHTTRSTGFTAGPLVWVNRFLKTRYN